MANITAYYTTASTWDMADVLEELGIEAHQVKDYYIKWDMLVLTYIDADGEEQEEEIAPTFCGTEQPDFKRPSDVEDEFREEITQ
jgi:hypothetical protein